jgi:hypothetical protein
MNLPVAINPPVLVINLLKVATAEIADKRFPRDIKYIYLGK